MTRVTSQRTRQAILVIGDEVDPFLLPENLQLFDTLGRPIDILKDSSRMRWAGVWAPDVVYAINDVVYHDGFLWIAPGDISVGIIPGIGYADPDIEVSRGVMFKQSDRLFNTTDQLYTIGPPPGKRRDNDITSGYSAAILIDKTGVTSGLVITITPVTSESPAGMQVVTYPSGGGVPDVLVTWSSAEVAGHVAKAIAVPNSNADRYCHIFFDGGIDGSFLARVSSITNLLPPPAFGTEWDVIVGQIPIGGTEGQKLIKASDVDYDVEWAADTTIFPPGGSLAQVLSKVSGADNDVAWANPTPRDVPVGGSTKQVLAKASGTDRDVAWVSSAGTTQRRTTAKTTASLAGATDTGSVATRLAGGSEVGTWVIGPGTLLTKIATSKACRVRLYTSTTKRTADISRDRFTDPSGDHGCLAEFLLISTLSMDNIPADYLASGSGDSNIYYAIENYDITAGAVTVTLTVKDVEV